MGRRETRSIPRLLIAATVPTTIRGFLLPFVQHYRNQGWHVDAAAQGVTQCEECVAAFDHVWDVDWSRNPMHPSNLVHTPRQLRELVAREGYDLVHVHTPVAAFVTRLALRGLKPSSRPKVIYTAHGFHFYAGGPTLKNMLFLGIEKLAGRWTDHLVVINREDEATARRWRLVAEGHIHYMSGIGVDYGCLRLENVSSTNVDKVRTELGLSSDTRLFLMIAEFNAGKRHSDLLTAFSQMESKGAHLALAGTGPLFEDMKQLAQRLGIDDRVHFLGFRRDIPSLIRASVATVLPSEREGLPRSIMESLCLSVPAIGTDIRGIRDLLKDGCGVLVPLGNVGALARALDWFLEHPKESSPMGARGRQKMADYDIVRILAEHDSLYEQALTNGRSSYSGRSKIEV